MTCCELVKVNLTIIKNAFDCAFDCAFAKSNVCGSHSNANANAFTISRKHLNAHSDAFAFVNKPVVGLFPISTLFPKYWKMS